MLELETLPYLTDGCPGIGGRLKTVPEDFIVEEIPLYQPSGQGQHVYLFLEKRGLSTYQAMQAIARRLRVAVRDIGYAGLKDAQAVTRQVISIDGAEPERVKSLDIPGIKVLWAARHRNKLKMGHLAGNRFTVRVRDVSQESKAPAGAILDELGRRGVPNYFGEQRFGARRNTHRLGWALLRNDAEAFAHQYLGDSQPGDPPQLRAARAAFDGGDYRAALSQWPFSLAEERRALRAIVQHQGELEPTLRILDKKLRRLFVSAYQSYVFNHLLADRIQTLDRIEAGDVAFIHASGAAFVVKDPVAEQPRADRLEISPSGPLFGPKTLLAEGEPGRRERAILKETGLSLEAFRLPGVRLKGARRPLRIPLTELEVAWEDGLILSFRLPPGAYATEVLREVMKRENTTLGEEQRED